MGQSKQLGAFLPLPSPLRHRGERAREWRTLDHLRIRLHNHDYTSFVACIIEIVHLIIHFDSIQTSHMN